MTDKLTPSHRSANMSKIRAKNTAPEMLVRRLVHSMGFRYRLHVSRLPGKPDLVFPRLKKIIDVRGCFWHQHRGCIDSHVPKSRQEYWAPKLKMNCQRDKKNRRKLRAQGWAVLTLWECELRDSAQVKKQVTAFLKSPKSSKTRKIHFAASVIKRTVPTIKSRTEHGQTV
jgi:DNA mismatch endonuclease (patch repair protein)